MFGAGVDGPATVGIVGGGAERGACAGSGAAGGECRLGLAAARDGADRRRRASRPSARRRATVRSASSTTVVVPSASLISSFPKDIVSYPMSGY